MSLLIPFITVLLGASFVFLGISNNKNRLRLLLAFSGAFLLSTTITSLLPDLFSYNNPSVSYWILAGIVVQIILENLTKGAEHGHIHLRHDSQLPWTLLIGLSLHAFIEGFPIHEHHELLWAIVVHKLPIAILLTAAIWQTKTSITTRLALLLGFALMTPFGTYLNSYVPFFKSFALHSTALVVGVMLHISTTILFESAENHKFNTSKIIVIFTGLGLAALLNV